MKYRVADFIIDTALFRISSGGAVVPIEPKVFDLLVHLIQNRERVLSREELFQAVWDGRDVSDATLSNHIKIARKALGDNGDLQRTIQTVRGRGYQFIAPVVELLDGTGGGESQARAPSVQPRSPKRWAPWLRPVAAAVLLLAGGSLVMPKFLGAPRTSQALNAMQEMTSPYVLVVPFEFSGTEPGLADQQWEDELTRRVIGNLREITGLRVKERATSFTLQKRTHDYMREALPDVRYVLDGIVLVRTDGVLEITVCLNEHALPGS